MTRKQQPQPSAGHNHISGSSILTYPSGLYVNPLDLDPALVRVEDVAHHLSRQARFSGATSGAYAYSVAQHVCLCAYLAQAHGGPELQYAALHHDDAEYVLQDLVRPLKEDPYFGKSYRGAEKRAEKVLAEVFGFEYPFPEIVKEIDLQMLALERDNLLHPNGEWEILEGVERPTIPELVPWTPNKARANYLTWHENLQKEMQNG